ncbi:MAG TPA: ABC transporter substrate-binding protein [Spirillospora sp.]
MRHSLRISALLSAVALVLAAATGCGDSDSSSGSGNLEKDTIKVAALPVADSAGLYIAQKEKLFEAEGLKVQVVPTQKSIEAMPALTKGEVDLVCPNYVNFLQAHEKGTLKLSIVAEAATMAPNLMNVLVMPNSDIKTAKDLEGKKVAVNLLNNIQSLTLNAILEANNVDYKKVQYVSVPFPQMATALEKGQVDAVHINEPFLSDAVKTLGARVVVDGGSEPVNGLAISGYVSTQEWVKKYPKTAAAFQRAMLKAQKLAAEDRKNVEAVLPGYSKMDPKVASVITLPGYPASVSKSRIEQVVDLMVSGGLLKEKPDVDSIVFQPTA